MKIVTVHFVQVQKPFANNSESRNYKILDLIHSDVCGPIRKESIGGNRYFVTFIDEKSGFVEVYFLKTKNQVKDCFLDYKAYNENQKNKKIKILRTDNGLEYWGGDFEQFLKNSGIKREFSTPYTPQQNGKAERMNRTLQEMARCMLLESGLPEFFWAEATQTAAYIRNRCTSRSTSSDATPYEIWYGSKPIVSHFKIFGAQAFVLNKNPNLGKFDPKSNECIFVGYSRESKAYMLWDPSQKKLIVSRDVEFIEKFNKRQ